jgi:hypothetical protein
MAVYPFVFVVAGVGLAQLKGAFRLLVLAVLSWSVVGIVQARPTYLAYFNEAIGGPAHGYEWVTDSNVDWGQELKNLPAALTEDEKRSGIYLCYFGVADPHHYGIRYWDVLSDRIIRRADNSADPDMNPTTFVISATNLQATYYSRRDIFDWLGTRQPRAVVGHSLFIYDLKGDIEALKMLKYLRGVS